MARVAEIESGAVQESRELILRSLQDEREAFSSALSRSARLTTTVEVLAGTVAEMTSAMRTQLDDAIEALRALREVGNPEPRHPAPEPPEPQEQAVVAVPQAPNPRVEPSPELTQMFREHITRMHDEGKSREEAERALLRFKLGHHFIEMLDEVYSFDAASRDTGRRR